MIIFILIALAIVSAAGNGTLFVLTARQKGRGFDIVQSPSPTTRRVICALLVSGSAAGSIVSLMLLSALIGALTQ